MDKAPGTAQVETKKYCDEFDEERQGKRYTAPWRRLICAKGLDASSNPSLDLRLFLSGIVVAPNLVRGPFNPRQEVSGLFMPTQDLLCQFVQALVHRPPIYHLPTIYVRHINATVAEKLAPGLAGNVAKDLDWLETELKQGNGRCLVGDYVTAANTMVAFSIQFILSLSLAPKEMKWEHVEAWLGYIKSESAYQRAVARTGHEL